MVRPGRDRLNGAIEVDETYVGGEKPGKRGRGALGKALIMIAAENDGEKIGRIRLIQIMDASGESLESAVKQSVETGSKVYTDEALAKVLKQDNLSFRVKREIFYNQ